MRITLYPLDAYNLGHELPFTIVLDDITLEAYYEALKIGLYEAQYPDGIGSVLSCRCLNCKTVFINKVEEKCPCCGAETLEKKQTDANLMIYVAEDIPQKYVGVLSLDHGFFNYLQFLKDTHLERKIVNAGLTLGFELHEIESAYQGTYYSDAMFAERYAIMSGTIKDADTWPFHYIDWKDAAAELMHRYTEVDNHYFIKYPTHKGMDFLG